MTLAVTLCRALELPEFLKILCLDVGGWSRLENTRTSPSPSLCVLCVCRVHITLTMDDAAAAVACVLFTYSPQL